MDADVPLLVPEIGGNDHLALVACQRDGRGWVGGDRHQPELLDGLPVDGPRAAAPVRLEVGDGHDAAGVSGAGYPGVASLDAVANVVPFIDGEKAKIERDAEDSGPRSPAIASIRIPSS